ncbi:MAG: prepilin-type N-terminal cleavage/methylation domain-containing protein, partial [Campylobacterota bacterium]|nr:prepilin-type N-terminal cleavage/methylation domain-containing protein [Campylobacterota bacterium]
MRKAFSLIELLIVITLAGVTAILAFNYLNMESISKNNIKLELQSHFNIITATILQCKEYSNIMPIQSGGSEASDTLLSTLECNTTTPYQLDGGKGAFIPPPLNDFTAYTATQNASEFYFSTRTSINSYSDEVLQELQTNYSTNQYELTSDATTTTLKFYLSR